MTSVNLATFCVRDESGAIDVGATVLKFEGEVQKYQAERELESETVGAAVNAVFDEHRGAVINMPAVTSMALTRLGVQPETYKVLSERVQEYIRTNATDTRGGLFRIAKGKGGGVTRWADCADKPTK